MSHAETGYTRDKETQAPLSDPPPFAVASSALPEDALGWSQKQIPAFSQDISVAPAGPGALLRVSQPKSLTWCDSCMHGEGQGLVQITCITKQKAALKNEDYHQNSPPPHAAFFF